MPQEVLAALRSALPATKVFLMYGLTEAFRSTYLPPEELEQITWRNAWSWLGIEPPR